MVIGVGIPICGDLDVWAPLAARAATSVRAQSQLCEGVVVVGKTVSEARNRVAQRLIEKKCEWLIFLDADDELHPDYVLRMALAASLSKERWPVFQPSTQGVVNGVKDSFPFINSPVDLLDHNYLGIGCMHKAEMFQKVGGFDDWPLLEDWAYWIKCYLHDAQVIQVPEAIYYAYIDDARPGRNKQSVELEYRTVAEIKAWSRHQALRSRS